MGSNEYPKSMFWAEIWKKSVFWSVFGGELFYIFEQACFRNSRPRKVPWYVIWNPVRFLTSPIKFSAEWNFSIVWFVFNFFVFIELVTLAGSGISHHRFRTPRSWPKYSYWNRKGVRALRLNFGLLPNNTFLHILCHYPSLSSNRNY